jgi:hypothetical protein
MRSKRSTVNRQTFAQTHLDHEHGGEAHTGAIGLLEGLEERSQAYKGVKPP